jgi:rhodanese-related sulfurtransferase
MSRKLTKGIKDLVAEAEADIQTISLANALEKHGSDDVLFVDVRDVRELERDGMIPGAYHAPRGMIEFWVDPESPYFKDVFGDEDKTYILYCAAAWRSALTTKTLKDMGMTNVVQFADGLKAWKEAGGPVGERSTKTK